MGTKLFRGVLLSTLALAPLTSAISPLPADLTSAASKEKPAVIYHPGRSTIEVEPGGAFLLRHRLSWGEADPGFYDITIAWECPENNPKENFTLLSTSAYFDLDGDNQPDEGLDPIEANVRFNEGPAPENENVWLYIVGVGSKEGDQRNGEFNVDIWLAAVGWEENHEPTENHPIDYVLAIDVMEYTWVSVYPPPITARVKGEGTAILYQIADAYVEDYNLANFGSEPELRVGSMEHEQWRTWPKFDISGLPRSATITSAKLWLYFHDVGEFGGAAGGIGAHLSENDNWGENSIAWGSEPSFNPTPTDSIPHFGDINVRRSWVVVPDVQGQLAGDGVITWCLKAAGEMFYEYNVVRSREHSDAAYRPYLEVRYYLT